MLLVRVDQVLKRGRSLHLIACVEMTQDELRATHIHQGVVPGQHQVLRPIGVAHQVQRQRGTLTGIQITLQHLLRHLTQFMPVGPLAAVLVQDGLGLGGRAPNRGEHRQRALDANAPEPVEDGRSGHPLAEPIRRIPRSWPCMK